ncbi:hypothetical protein AB0F81_35030 [Actinoplanes sp. NPDC024001]|uniref:hypothetical protein n=1 Tax=Actinoplanes sp. NPDC024001 TaxID=3154598 RepID=UPI003404C9B1
MVDKSLAELPLGDRTLLFLTLAALCLVVAIRLVRRALEPLGAIVETVAAAAAVFLALGLALVLVLAATLTR